MILLYFFYRQKGTVLQAFSAHKEEAQKYFLLQERYTFIERQLYEKESKLNDLQETLNAALLEKGALEEKALQLPIIQEEVIRLRQANFDLYGKNKELLADLEHEKCQLQDKIMLIEKLELKMSETFKALSSEALASNNGNFIHLAKAVLEKFQESAQKDLLNRQQAIEQAIQPVTKTLQQVDEKIILLEKERKSSFDVLKEKIVDLASANKELKNETSNLVKALKAPHIRGQWGEIQLKRVVEMSGMLPYCDFVEQHSLDYEDGKLRPDMLIHLPGNKRIIVDAKAPLSAYLEALESNDESVKVKKIEEHIKQVRIHIKQLSQKSYWEQVNGSIDFVILFLPGENFFSMAMENDPGLIEYGITQKVIIATPTTLIAMLKAISYGWRQESITQNAAEISKLGKELYKRLLDMFSHFSRLGKSLNSSVDSYNQTLGSLERRVMVSARKFGELNEVQEIAPIVDEIEKRPQQILHTIQS